MDVNEQYFKAHGKPLFSSHMLDLSEEPLEEIISTCEKYLGRMAKMGITLELEIGITGGEEDGVDNSGISSVCCLSCFVSPKLPFWQQHHARSAVDRYCPFDPLPLTLSFVVRRSCTPILKTFGRCTSV